MNLNFTAHSKKRMQQRCISIEAVKHIVNYGNYQYDGLGAKVYFINKNQRESFTSLRKNKDSKKIRKQLNSYVVVSEDSASVITVGHRIKRRKRC